MVRQLDGGRGHLAEAVQAVQHHGAGALHFAAWCKKVEVCEYLVEDVQVDVDAVDQAGVSARYLCDFPQANLACRRYIESLNVCSENFICLF